MHMYFWKGLLTCDAIYERDTPSTDIMREMTGEENGKGVAHHGTRNIHQINETLDILLLKPQAKKVSMRESDA